MTDFSKLPGFIQELPPIRLYAPANNGNQALAVVSGSANIPVIRILGVVVRSRGATTINLTDIQVLAGTGDVLTLIDSTTGALANLDAAAKQVGWDGGQGGIVLANGEDISTVLTGTGAAYVDFDIAIRYAIIDPGATLEEIV